MIHFQGQTLLIEINKEQIILLDQTVHSDIKKRMEPVVEVKGQGHSSWGGWGLPGRSWVH
jgi:hypothetical protein